MTMLSYEVPDVDRSFLHLPDPNEDPEVKRRAQAELKQYMDSRPGKDQYGTTIDPEGGFITDLEEYYQNRSEAAQAARDESREPAKDYFSMNIVQLVGGVAAARYSGDADESRHLNSILSYKINQAVEKQRTRDPSEVNKREDYQANVTSLIEKRLEKLRGEAGGVAEEAALSEPEREPEREPEPEEAAAPPVIEEAGPGGADEVVAEEEKPDTADQAPEPEFEEAVEGVAAHDNVVALPQRSEPEGASLRAATEKDGHMETTVQYNRSRTGDVRLGLEYRRLGDVITWDMPYLSPEKRKMIVRTHDGERAGMIYVNKNEIYDISESERTNTKVRRDDNFFGQDPPPIEIGKPWNLPGYITDPVQSVEVETEVVNVNMMDESDQQDLWAHQARGPDPFEEAEDKLASLDGEVNENIEAVPAPPPSEQGAVAASHVNPGSRRTRPPTFKDRMRQAYKDQKERRGNTRGAAVAAALGAGAVLAGEYYADPERGGRRLLVTAAAVLVGTLALAGFAFQEGGQIGGKKAIQEYKKHVPPPKKSPGGTRPGTTTPTPPPPSSEVGRMPAGSSRSARTLSLSTGSNPWYEIHGYLQRYGYNHGNASVARVTDAVLSRYGLSEYQARHLRTGYRFTIPRGVLESINRTS